MRWRLLLVPLFTLLMTAAALEALARVMDLDSRQRRAIQVDEDLLIARMTGDPGAELGVDYLPRAFTLDAKGYFSPWGRCSFDHAGPTALIFGDSVTRQAAKPFSARPTWPAELQRALPRGWQLCVFAEDGYHPSDYAAAARFLAPKLQPELVLVQLCENDLMNARAPVVEPLPEGGVALYAPVTRLYAYAPLYHEALYARSEALRFLHWRLQARYGQTLQLDLNDEGSERPLAAALQSLHDLGALLFLVPRLEDGRSAPPAEAWSRVEDSGVPVAQVQLPGPLIGLRFQAHDPVHLSPEGHRLLAEQLKAIPAVAAILDGD